MIVERRGKRQSKRGCVDKKEIAVILSVCHWIDPDRPDYKPSHAKRCYPRMDSTTTQWYVYIVQCTESASSSSSSFSFHVFSPRSIYRRVVSSPLNISHPFKLYMYSMYIVIYFICICRYALDFVWRICSKSVVKGFCCKRTYAHQNTSISNSSVCVCVWTHKLSSRAEHKI